MMDGSGSSCDDGQQGQSRVLLTRRTLRIWMYAACVGASLTVLALFFYMLSDLPNRWGFHVGPWAKTKPLRLPFFVSLGMGLIFNRILFGISPQLPGSVTVWEREKVPEILAYYPRTFKEAIRVLFVLVDFLCAISVCYLGIVELYIEPIGLFYK